jgi:hypothetical protein
VPTENIIELIRAGNVEVLSVCQWQPGGHEGAVFAARKLAGLPVAGRGVARPGTSGQAGCKFS